MRQIVLDTETTGLEVENGHRIIEIGCIELVNRKITGKRFHKYINPQRAIEEGAHAVHGLTTQFLQDKPCFADIAHELMDFIGDSELIIHNAPFDVGFINHELKLCENKWRALTDYCRVIDTLAMARQLHVGQRNSLDALCKRYSIDNSQRELHGALLDAHLLAQVFLAMTGGQGSLFDELQTNEIATHATKAYSTPVTHARSLRVLKASAEELAMHQEQLAKMLKKGKCVWLQSE